MTDTADTESYDERAGCVSAPGWLVVLLVCGGGAILLALLLVGAMLQALNGTL